jgi:hypothetical protein
MRILMCTMLMAGLFGTTTFAMGDRQLAAPSFQFYIVPTAGPESAEFELSLKNDGEIPLNFEFPTSQLFEISVQNSKGEEVFLYSKDRFFLQAFQKIRIEPQKTFHRAVRWNYQFNGKRVPEGEYTVNVTFKPTRLNDEPIKNRENLSVTQKMFIPTKNPLFHHVNIEGTKGHYLVKGEAQSSKFFYSVEDGHFEYVGEKQLYLTEKRPSFQIEIQIPAEKLPKKGSLILYLYERNQENKMIHSYPVILERF